jgi:hypothetical protein
MALTIFAKAISVCDSQYLLSVVIPVVRVSVMVVNVTITVVVIVTMRRADLHNNLRIRWF